jgi:predicted transcriptional regulator of viral defense system
MKTDILHLFETIPYFTIEGFRQISGMESPHSVRVLLHRWAQAGHIFPLKKGVYMTRRFYEQHRQDAAFSPAVSAMILPHSYVSLEYVLQQHNLLTEVTYPVTCITPRNTRTITNEIGVFWYRNIRADLYSGFALSEYFGVRYASASLPKALFDYLYLRPVPAAFRSPKINLAEELRLNLDELDETARGEFAVFAESSASQKMREILGNFRRNSWQI